MTIMDLIIHTTALPHNDPEACLEDFEERAASHARNVARRLDHQDASIQRFLELNGDDFAPTA